MKAAVLVGGLHFIEPVLAAATPQLGRRRLDDPAKRTSPIARYGHATALLAQDRVLVIGGLTESGTLANCQLYDANSRFWYEVAPMARARGRHSATRLPDGRIAVLGGFDHGPLALTSIFDPDTDTWAPGTPLKVARYQHTAQALNDGRVVLTGGFGVGLLSEAEVWEP